MNPQFVVQFCVPPENRFLIAELYFGNEHWAELNTEHDCLQVRFFPRSSGEPWEFTLADALDALRNAELEMRRRSVFFDGDGSDAGEDHPETSNCRTNR